MPEIVTTASELDALPVRSVVLDREGGPWMRHTGSLFNPWVGADVIATHSERLARKWGPLTVIYRPDAEPGTDRLDVQTAMAYGLGVEDGQRQPARTPTEEQVILALHREWDRQPGESACECDLIDIAEIGDLDTLTRQARAVADLYSRADS